MRDFNQRSKQAELMDDETISFEEFHDCLVGLERINHLTLAYRPTLQWLTRWFKTDESLYLLDVASGGGDMLRQIAKKWPRRTEKNTQLIGVDLNPWSKISAEHLSGGIAQSSTQQLRKHVAPPITYKTADIFKFNSEQPIDIIISSLFTHHLTDAQIVEFLRWMDSRARKGWFINDLHRHAIPYYFIKAATAIFSRNRLIRNDAAVSVARSFSVADWKHFITQAGLVNRVRIEWFFPFRLCISCIKDATTASS
jgi:2-polyprenyl-3-methyl-5-hydroxy-6-metoxy-1,4-benzoquinol methylase